MEIRRSLEQGEYNDPVQVRRLLKSSRFAKQEFKDAHVISGWGPRDFPWGPT